MLQRLGRPDPVTGRVDMSGVGDIYELARPGFTNFDFGFWDEATQSFWHASHGTYPGMETPQEVYQSTHGRFARKYWANGEEHVSYPPCTRARSSSPRSRRRSSGARADAARRLNGFDDADIKKLAQALTHDERTSIIGAAYGAMPGWSDRVGEQVTLVGTALDAAAGAIVSLDGFPVYVAGLRGWPQELFGQEVEVTGTLVFRPGAPRGVHGPGESYALEDASWAPSGGASR